MIILGSSHYPMIWDPPKPEMHKDKVRARSETEPDCRCQETVSTECVGIIDFMVLGLECRRCRVS